MIWIAGQGVSFFFVDPSGKTPYACKMVIDVPHQLTKWQRDRRALIEHRIYWHGSIGLADLMVVMEISRAQASKDLNGYISDHPDHLHYDKSARTYVMGRAFEAHYLSIDPDGISRRSRRYCQRGCRAEVGLGRRSSRHTRTDDPGARSETVDCAQCPSRLRAAPTARGQLSIDVISRTNQTRYCSSWHRT